MSIRSRARFLKSLNNNSLQRCEALIQRLGRASADLATKNRWPLKRADAFSISSILSGSASSVAVSTNTPISERIPSPSHWLRDA